MYAYRCSVLYTVKPHNTMPLGERKWHDIKFLYIQVIEKTVGRMVARYSGAGIQRFYCILRSRLILENKYILDLDGIIFFSDEQ